MAKLNVLALTLVISLSVSLSGSANASPGKNPRVESYELILRHVRISAPGLHIRDQIPMIAKASLCLWENHRDLCVMTTPLTQWQGRGRSTQVLLVNPNSLYGDTLRFSLDPIWIASGIQALFPNRSVRELGETAEHYFDRLNAKPETQDMVRRPFLKIEVEALESKFNRAEKFGDLVYGLHYDLVGLVRPWSLRVRDRAMGSKFQTMTVRYVTELWGFGPMRELPVFKTGRPAARCVEYQTRVGGQVRFAVVDTNGYSRLGVFATAKEALAFIANEKSCSFAKL